jgi:hypothetical protein
MAIPEIVHDKIKLWLQENGPIKCEGVKHTNLMKDVRIAFEQSGAPLPKDLRKCIANLLQRHRGVIIKGERKGELPGLHPDKVRERNGSEKQKESKRKWNQSENGKAVKARHNKARYQGNK